ncbi:MAG TPA: TetR/AcrR family transcriptional regulator [Spirochaetota bacterium]|nr:TetR/AcrR family transcriptional regulator [Spirochaetota bacterium]HOD16451.1 TetR/AcrR family transcriptional regulator [Spirochaetota bacterium]HPG50216.1 TetR/AcrR family transcriptional regulator [Spirochaetota bacterium]HPN11272.1 TetR/AcrR family transcriptional regulator [Spirochaetota bacterium]HQL83515.1 TetR/AcrR family transcriptional regulator [Spirochaetota bacterium]
MPKIVDHDKYRKELADKCMDLFSKKGYANVTMREISKELGVSTGSLYHYFPNKEAIFAHMAEHLSQTDVATVLAKVDDSSGARERLTVYGDHWSANRGYYQSIILLAIDFIRNYTGQDKDIVKREYVQYYIDAMAENLGVPEELARYIYVHMIGLFYYELVFPGTDAFGKQLELFIDMFIAYAEKLDRASAAPVPNGRKGRTAG